MQWSPVHPDKFITWGTDINLYEVKPLRDAPQSSQYISLTNLLHALTKIEDFSQCLQHMYSQHYFFCQGIKISETTVAHLLASNSNHPYVKCVDIYPHNDTDVLLAIGQINGKVVLTTFGPTVFDCLGLSGKELGNGSPPFQKCCHSHCF